MSCTESKLGPGSDIEDSATNTEDALSYTDARDCTDSHTCINDLDDDFDMEQPTLSSDM